MKVAIVCDWLTGIGGAERVVYELHKIYPDAPIYTSQYDAGSIDWFEDADIRTAWLQTLPKGLKKFLPAFRAWTFGRLDLSEYDVVISSSGAEAKGIKTGPKTIHICYMHSPTHYYWIRTKEYLDNPGFPLGLNWVAKLGLKLMIEPMKRWDKQAAKRPDYIVTNSTYSQENIKKIYKRESSIIFPPVDTEKFKIKGTPPLRHGFIVAGRQTPYKRFDLAIEACKELKVPLVVVGDGPDHRRLEKLGSRSTTFLSNVNDHDLAMHFQSSIGFIMPNADDFGIIAVEAMAAGTPVIAYNQGGAQDYMQTGKTGALFDKQNVKSLTAALDSVANKSFNHEVIAEHAAEFSIAKFRKDITEFINEHLNKNRN
jgi:glycosyltransferase involved in cell wall biosynthesis